MARLCGLALLGLFVSSCLTWFPEPEPNDDDSADADDDDDDATTDDDDDATVNDDDATVNDDDVTGDDDDVVEPESLLEAHAVGFLLTVDSDDPGTFAAALFTEELLAPSIEEALFEDVLGLTYPAFGSPGGRLLAPGDHYDPAGLPEGDVQYLVEDVSTPLGFTGLGYGPFIGAPVDGFGPGSRWVMAVSGVPGFDGEWDAPVLPEPTDVTFLRQVGDAVFLPAGRDLEMTSTPAGPEVVDHLILAADDGGLVPATGFPVEPDGSAVVAFGDLPSEFATQEEGAIVVYRAARLAVPADAGHLLLVTARWRPLDLRVLPTGVTFLTLSAPPSVPFGETAVVTVHAEDPVFTPGEAYSVQFGPTSGTGEATSTTDLTASFSGPTLSSAVVELEVTDSVGARVGSGAGAIQLGPLACDLSEAEPNNTFAQSQFVLADTTSCGTLDPAGEVDTYRFIATTATTYVIETVADRLGYPTDTTLTLRDGTGATVAENDDTWFLDSSITWTAAAGGPMFIQVSSSGGGPDADYQLLLSAP